MAPPLSRGVIVNHHPRDHGRKSEGSYGFPEILSLRKVFKCSDKNVLKLLIFYLNVWFTVLNRVGQSNMG